MALTAELMDDLAAVEPYRQEWDALAVAAGRPYCAPAWMVAWWEEAAPAAGELRVVVALRGAELVGVVPLWARAADARYGVLAERTSSPVEPLAVPGLESEVAAVAADALAGMTPTPAEIGFQGLPGESPWPRLIADAWPGAERPALAATRSERVPTVALVHRDPDAWLAGRSRNFRQQVRRSRRRLVGAGARFRVSGETQLDRDLEAFARLHHSRWTARGGSGALDARVMALLRRAGRELLPLGRFRLWLLEVEGRPVSAHLFVAAGARQSYWLGGFDEAWSASHPSIQVLVEAIRDGIERGEELMELGPGAQPYKYRLADADESLTWVRVGPIPLPAADAPAAGTWKRA